MKFRVDTLELFLLDAQFSASAKKLNAGHVEECQMKTEMKTIVRVMRSVIKTQENKK